ncbi:hypothetical protein RLOatenuis_5000 [Rickettsiales bacterium]|nr:hypothetical protein RLOatenuis_5000 [Rickettsiales bacterium]
MTGYPELRDRLFSMLFYAADSQMSRILLRSEEFVATGTSFKQDEMDDALGSHIEFANLALDGYLSSKL